MAASEPGPPPPVAPLQPEGPLDAGAPTFSSGSSVGSSSGPSPGHAPARPAPVVGAPSLPLLPRGVGEVVDTAIGIYRRNWKLLVGTAAVVVVPIEFLSALLNRNYFSQVRQFINAFKTGVAPASGTNGRGLLGSLLLFLTLPFLTAAIATAAAGCSMGHPMTVGKVWRTALRRFWAILGLGVLRFLLIVAASFVFLVPAIYLYIKLLLSPVALMVEDAGPISAMERSWRLTSGNWWRTCGVEVLKVMVAWFGLVLVQMPPLLLGFVSGRAGWVFLGIAGTLGQAAFIPFVVVVTVVVYFDLRIRREAFDLAVTAQQVQAARAA